MKLNKKKEEYQKKIEKVIMLRGGSPVRSLLGAFGSSLKETRLTAMLGYLIAQNPFPWQKYFLLKDNISEVSVEFGRDEGRADIWMISRLLRVRSLLLHLALFSAILPSCPAPSA